ncbi:protein LIM3-like [Wolffia australiana]
MATAQRSSSILVLKVLSLILVAILTHPAMASGNCTDDITSLAACAPFVLPGASSPNMECCSALSSVQRSCLCSTLNILTSLPNSCSLTPVSCSSP